MALTLLNCEKMVDIEVRNQAWSIFRANKVIKVTNIDVNEHIGSLYEAEIKEGKKNYTLCFAITKFNTIILGKCYCGLAEGVLCPHYLAVLLHLKYKKSIEMSKNIYCPVRVIFASSNHDPLSVSETVDTVFERYIRKGEIDNWYIQYAVEGIIFACMCADDENKNLTERVSLYCVALKKLDKLFTLSKKPYMQLLIEHAKGVIQLIDSFLKENLPKQSLIVVKPCYELFYKTSCEIVTWEIKYNVWESILLFCDTPSIRIDYQSKLKQKIYNQKDEKKKTDLKILYLLLLRSYNTRLASEYLFENLNDSAFRKISIDLHISAKQYKDAIDLAKEGLSLDKNNELKTKNWWKLLYKIYSKLNDKGNMKKYAKLLILSGDFDYYLYYKKINEKNSWIKERENILNIIKEKDMNELYLQIIIEDNLQDRLFDFCIHEPSRILTLYPYLDKYYYDNLISILQDYRNNITDIGDVKMINLVIRKMSLLN